MKKILFKSLLVTSLVGLTVYFYASLPNVAGLRRTNPRTSALMELRDKEYRQKGLRAPPQRVWVSYGAISDHLKRAVLVSEDASFFNHPGIDFQELQAAMKTDWESMSFKRGGSTITMQLAKNLYLTPSKNPLRKLREILIAWQLERALSKKRIFEIYLNVVEWGHNIYGAEAAARYYFSKSAAALDPLEAATLAALLPNPRNAREKSLLYRRNLILSRFVTVGHMTEEEYNRVKQMPLSQKADKTAHSLSAER